MEYIGDAIELRCLRRGQPDPRCTLSGHFCGGETAANRVTRDQHALTHSVDGFAKAAADLPTKAGDWRLTWTVRWPAECASVIPDRH